MKRKWVAFLMVAGILVSPAPGAVSLLATTALLLHTLEHEHAVHLVEDEGHRRLVLSHGEEGGPVDHGRPTGSGRGESFTPADHAVDLSEEGAARTPSRRPPPDQPSVLFDAAPALDSALARQAAMRRCGEPRVPTIDLVRTVVLRL